MRKVILLEHVTLDGFVAGPNGEMDWIYSMTKCSIMLDSSPRSDTAIYGRVTLSNDGELTGPLRVINPVQPNMTIDHHNWYNKSLKIVFSKTLTETPVIIHALLRRM